MRAGQNNNQRLSQNSEGRLVLGGRPLQAGEEIEVKVGSNWHRALVRKTSGRWEFILDTGRATGGVRLLARWPESKTSNKKR